jgi:hypothetical protein
LHKIGVDDAKMCSLQLDEDVVVMSTLLDNVVAVALVIVAPRSNPVM